MSFRSRAALTISTLLLTVSFIACGGDPPEREMQQAEVAIAAAVAAGADMYATDELKAAQAALANGRAAVTARDYRLALNHALDSRERAQNAATQASAALAAARSTADAAIGAATTTLGAVKTRLGAVESAGARNVTALKASVADVESELQKARTAWEAKDFPTASSAAAAATQRLAGLSGEIDELTPASRRRR
jgi:hypothetical protein